MRRFVTLGLVAVLIAGLGGGSASASKSKTTMYGAITKQQWPVLFHISSDRKLVVEMAIVLDETCKSGQVLSGIGTGDKAISISKSGAIRDSFSGGPMALSNGKVIQYSDRITAKFNKARTVITGTWRETTTINDPAAGTSDTCDSGAVRFKAVD
jgi:hypothetical protein